MSCLMSLMLIVNLPYAETTWLGKSILSKSDFEQTAFKLGHTMKH